MPDAQVSSPTRLDIALADPTRLLIVCSGIAIAGSDSGGSLDFETYRVDLGVRAAVLHGSTVLVALAGINNDDTEFIFSTDNAHLEWDMQTGAISLVCVLAVQGHHSILSRFAYQVHMVVSAAQPQVSGTIRWSADLARDVGARRHRFTVSAGESMPDPSNPAFTVFTAEAITHEQITPLRSLSPDHELNYSLPIPLDLLGTAFEVHCEMLPRAFAPQPGVAGLVMNQVAGPSLVILTPAHPDEPGVNFEMAGAAPVK